MLRFVLLFSLLHRFVTPHCYLNLSNTYPRPFCFFWVDRPKTQFLTTFTLSLMKSIDIRSEAAVNLLAEFLDMDSDAHGQGVGGESGATRKNAEHFAHGEFSSFYFGMLFYPIFPILFLLSLFRHLIIILQSHQITPPCTPNIC